MGDTLKVYALNIGSYTVKSYIDNNWTTKNQDFIVEIPSSNNVPMFTYLLYDKEYLDHYSLSNGDEVISTFTSYMNTKLKVEDMYSISFDDKMNSIISSKYTIASKYSHSATKPYDLMTDSWSEVTKYWGDHGSVDMWKVVEGKNTSTLNHGFDVLLALTGVYRDYTVDPTKAFMAKASQNGNSAAIMAGIKGYYWDADTVNDYMKVVAHEIGHLFNISHTPDDYEENLFHKKASKFIWYMFIESAEQIVDKFINPV